MSGHASGEVLAPMPFDKLFVPTNGHAPVVAIADPTVERSRRRDGLPVIGDTATELPFYTASQIAAMTSTEPEWIIPGYVALQALTELDGKVKSAGKTTLTLDAWGRS